jgi:hypothetical protein
MFQMIYEYGEQRWNAVDKVKVRNSEKVCLSATLPTKNPSWNNLCTNPVLSGERPATNRLSYGKAINPLKTELV